MIKTVIDTDIRIHTRSRRLTLDRMQEHRIAQITVQGHEMIGLIRQTRERTRTDAQEYATYYENIPFQYLIVINNYNRAAKLQKKSQIRKKMTKKMRICFQKQLFFDIYTTKKAAEAAFFAILPISYFTPTLRPVTS